MAEITFKNVNKIFAGEVAAVDDFQLRVQDGEMIVLVGPSGCGKSTVLRMVAGLEQATSGEIWIGDKCVNGLPPEQRDVAMVFQNYALYPHMTVRKNLAFPLKMMKMPKDQINKRVDEIAGLLGLNHLLDRRPKQLSGGQRQRIAMGRALVREPDVFLLDEPLSNLDAKLRVQMRAEITALQRRLKTTTIYVTHDQVEAMTMGDRLVVLKNGVLQQVGRPQEIYTQPVNTFVATFIGSPSMNLFLSKLKKKDSGKFDFEFAGKVLPVSSELLSQQEELEVLDGQDVIIGLRPEAFCPPEEVPENARIQVQVTHLEEMGHEFIAYFTTPGRKLPPEAQRQLAADAAEKKGEQQETETNDLFMVARLPPAIQLKVGETAMLGVESSRCYIFNMNGSAVKTEN